VKRALAALLLATCTAAVAQELNDQQDRAIAHSPRSCAACLPNQSIADSSAAGGDLRAQVRSQILAGKSDARSSLRHARYGDFILYRPRLKSSTLLLCSRR